MAGVGFVRVGFGAAEPCLFESNIFLAAGFGAGSGASHSSGAAPIMRACSGAGQGSDEGGQLCDEALRGERALEMRRVAPSQSVHDDRHCVLQRAAAGRYCQGTAEVLPRRSCREALFQTCRARVCLINALLGGTQESGGLAALVLLGIEQFVLRWQRAWSNISHPWPSPGPAPAIALGLALTRAPAPALALALTCWWHGERCLWSNISRWRPVEPAPAACSGSNARPSAPNCSIRL